MTKPSPNGANGRESNGRFAPGNAGGPGNPHAARVAAIRSLLLDSVTDDDLRQVVAKLVEMAKSGDMAAIRELFDRLFGRPTTPIVADIESIDEKLGPHVRIIEDDDWYGNADRIRELRAAQVHANADNGGDP